MSIALATRVAELATEVAQLKATVTLQATTIGVLQRAVRDRESEIVSLQADVESILERMASDGDTAPTPEQTPQSVKTVKSNGAKRF